jgi:2-polyprenyl-6-hydroxyphenyl methylase/3-demethylubiquinone-9 3-methyltransferase
MLAHADGISRVRGTARRLPLAPDAFDAVIGVEVLEHVLDIDAAVHEIHRVLKPGGRIAVIDKNAASLNADRPWLPSLLVKWYDERMGRWMYPPGAPVRERWFWPPVLRRCLSRRFVDCGFEYLLSPAEHAHAVFRRFPAARIMTLWTARKPGGSLG